MALSQDVPQSIVAPTPSGPLETLLRIPATLIQVATRLLNAVLAPIFWPAPSAPAVDQPLLWAVLAFVRRQFGNDTPAINESIGTPDASGDIKITLNATDAEGDVLVYTATGATKGTLVAGADGRSFTYDPNPGATGTDTITITASDAANGHIHGLAGLFAPDGGHVVTKQITLTIANPQTNQPPTLNLPPASALTPDADGSVTFTVSGTDASGRPVTFSANTTQGSVSSVTPNSFRYTPGDYAHTLAADGYAGPWAAVLTVAATDSDGNITTSTLTVPVTPTNTSPALTGVGTAGTPDRADGSVPISTPVTDADHDVLTYTHTSTKGDVAFVDGALVYTPNSAARHAAAADGAAQADRQDSFTVTVSDGHGGVTSMAVTVDVAASGVVSAIAIPGRASGGLQYTADGTRAVLTTSEATYAGGVSTTTTRVVVIDRATGRQIGTTTTLTGSSADDFGQRYYPATLTADGTRAIQTTRESLYANGSYTYTTRVAVVDVTTGNQVGETITLGGSAGLTELSADGTRFTQTTQDSTYDGSTGLYTQTTRVAVVDVATGAQVGTTTTTAITQSGSYGTSQSTSDGTRVVRTTREDTVVDGITTYTTRVVVFDTATGSQVGATITLAGSSADYSGLRLSADGTRAVVSTSERVYDSNVGYYVETTRVVVVDTATGAQVGATTMLAGRPDVTRLTADGSRAVVTTEEGVYDRNNYTTVYTTRVAVIDTATGARLGTATTSGRDSITQLTADGNRAILTARQETYDWHSGIRAYSVNVVVLDTVTGTQVGATTTLAGSTYSAAQLSADGTRAVVSTSDSTQNPFTEVTTYTSRVAVIDTATGAQVGTTTTLAGSSDTTVLNADGSRAIHTSHTYDDETLTYTARVAVIDVTTGSQVGTTTTLVGYAGATQFFAAGTRAIVTTQQETYIDGVGTSAYTTRLAVIDTITGTRLGTTTVLEGSSSRTLLDADETRIVEIVGDQDRATYDYTSRIAVIDATTGGQIGNTITVRGRISSGGPIGPGEIRYPAAQFTADGKRVVLTTSGSEASSGTSVTSVSVIDIGTGSQIGTTVDVTGGAVGGTPLVAGDTRAIQATSAYASIDGAYVYSTHVAVIDITSGAQVGATTVLAGYSRAVQLSPDGTRIAATASTSDDDTGVDETRVVIVDVATGTQIGASPALGGSATGAPQFSADGTRITQTTTVYDQTTNLQTTHVTVIDIDQTGSNQLPVVTTSAVHQPEADGKVTGSVHFTDPDADTLTYAGTGATPRGTVVVRPDGGFTYTPNEAARLAAAKINAPAGAKQDVITIIAYDGHGGATSTAVTVTILPKNTAPEVAPSAGHFVNGMLTGTVNGTDVDGHSLTYSVAAQGAKGLVSVDRTTGAFTYTPTAGARDDASATAEDVDTDTFAITIDDGHGGLVTHAVTVDVQQSGVVANGTVDLTAPAAPLQYSPDGTRAIRVTTARFETEHLYVYRQRTFIAVVDTASGAQIGETVTVDGDGSGRPLQYSADGAFASQITVVSRNGTVYRTRVTIIDTATGDVIATTTLDGGSPLATTFTPDGGYALQTTTSSRQVYNQGDGTYTNTYASQVVAINTASGAVARVEVPVGLSGLASDGAPAFDPTGTRAIYRTVSHNSIGALFVDVATGAVTEFSAPGDWGNISLSGDRTRLVVETVGDTDDLQATVTRYAVVDAATGIQVGSTVELTSLRYSGYALNGDRLVVMELEQDPSSGTVTRVTGIDLDTGTVVGSPLTILGQASQMQFSPDGSRGVLAAAYGDGSVVVIDTATFTQIGGLTDLGDSVNAVEFSADGSRVFVTGRSGYDVNTSAIRLAIVDTSTGAQIGTVTTVSGYGQAQFTGDDLRVVLTAYNGTDTRVVVIDAVTGAQIGGTVSVSGSGQTEVNSTGTRATLATSAYDSASQTYTSRVATVDLSTGTQVGTTLVLSGYTNPQISADGSRAVLSIHGVESATGYTTRVVVVDMATGAHIGDTFSQAGVGEATFASDSSRIVVRTHSYGDQGEATRIAVLDAVSGAQLGNTVTALGQNQGWASTPDGLHAIMGTYSAATDTTDLTLVDLVDGTQVGDTIVAPRYVSPSSVRFNADGSRAAFELQPDGSDDDTHRVLVVSTVTGASQTFALRGDAQGSGRFTPDGTRYIADSYDDSELVGGYDVRSGFTRNATTILGL